MIYRDDACPHCEASLAGDPIPEAEHSAYGGITHYSRVIGVEVRGVYDGMLYWQCPDCHMAWPRFEGGPLGDDRLAQLSAEYVAIHNNIAAEAVTR